MNTAHQMPLHFEWCSPASIASEGPQVRRDWRHDDGAEKLHGLEESIRQHGVLPPLLVRSVQGQGEGQPYQLVAGHRRLTAARRAGLDLVPVLVRDLSDDDKDLVQLTENLQRQNLSAIDEAVAMQRLLERRGWTQTELAAILGVSSSFVSTRTLLLRDSLLRDAVSAGLIAATTATLLRQAGDDEHTRPLYERLERGERVREPEVRAARFLSEDSQLTTRTSKEGQAAPGKDASRSRMGTYQAHTEETIRRVAALKAEGKSPAEIALILGVSPSAVYGYQTRASEASASTHPASPAAEVPRDELRSLAVGLRRDGLSLEAIGARIGASRTTAGILLAEADATERADAPPAETISAAGGTFRVSDLLPTSQAQEPSVATRQAGPASMATQSPPALSTQHPAEDTPREYYSRDPAHIVVEAPAPRVGLVPGEQSLDDRLDTMRSSPCWLPLGRLLAKAAQDGLSAAEMLAAYRLRGR